MKSIQTKFIILILAGILLSVVIIGGAGVVNSNAVIDKDSAKIMNLLCSQKAEELDALLGRIEQSVETMAVYALDRLESLDKLINDDSYRDGYTKELERLVVNVANNTEGAVAVYVRYNPNFTPPTSGLFWSKTDLNGSFQQFVPTDFSSYSPSDVEHVGWYYLPVKNGKATWINPYLNKNININMISYVIPLYKEHEVIGVVGMDIDFGIITDSIKEINLYETGYAFLTDEEAMIMYHKDLSGGLSMRNEGKGLAQVADELKNGTSGSFLFDYKWGGQDKKMAFRSLSNDMRLVITAPSKEIDEAKNELLLQIIIATLIISVSFIVITITITRKIIRPLKELNSAAQKIANGDLSVSFTHQTKDEVGTLADSFQQTVNHLQKYINYINGLAYRDSLTGVKNKTAYLEKAQQLEEQMHLGRPEFAVVVLDVNGLKMVNDTYGHDFGDTLLINTSKIICKVFKRSPVYRIGGDEFVVILENEDYNHHAKLLAELEDTMKMDIINSPEQYNTVSLARGIAVYNYEMDLAFANVFKRADEAMYENKAKIKKKSEAMMNQ